MFVGPGDKAKRNGYPFLGRFGFVGIDAHTLKELVVLQFRKCLSEDIVLLAGMRSDLIVTVQEML